MKRLRRAHYTLIGLALLVLLGAGWIPFQTDSTSSRINSANFAKIKKGMTKEEVYAILGKPLFNFSCGFARFSADSWSSFREDKPCPWVPNRTGIMVIFDEEGFVEKADLTIEKRSWKERFAEYLPN
jgi:outer membrane protein assembly factor BamE (lipoprotein component of BamABCDE complex)